MQGNSPQQRKAQLDKEEREHLEDIVTEMRERVEANVRYQLEEYDLEDEPAEDASLRDEQEDLVEAIELEIVDGDEWADGYEQYITGVGYTIVNRLAALRCMEVRGFIDDEVTAFREDGLTPAADRLVTEEFMLEEEAVLEAYRNVCDDLTEEIEILFDRSTVYSLVDPDDDTFEELCGMLDDVPDAVWRADDVLGWVYEYYNRPVVEALDAKNTLEPEDVGPANQFYTPHWVVRMLTDNSLGKLYLESTGNESTVPAPEDLSPEERKERLVTPEDAPDIPSLCTYLIPDNENQEAPSFDHPSELRVIDPACGSGHFLLYAFDVLERIWWTETDLDRGEIPAKILEHNLYGVDIDLRSCQLSAFNLYLKARTRAEQEGNDRFEIPTVGIVCADARVAEVETAVDVLDEITGEGTDVREALEEIIEEFQTTEALGSLLDVQSVLAEEFVKDQTDVMEWSGEGPHTLNGFLKRLRTAVEKRTSDSFGEQNLRSLLHLLVVLTQDYDVALMNPPYGMRGRMPEDVKSYVEQQYQHYPDYYINFFEVCERLSKEHGRVGMLIPWSFMFRKVFESFRVDFVGEDRRFDFLAEFGYDILDNATVGTVGTVVRVGTAGNGKGTFIRLHDVPKADKESRLLNAAFVNAYDGDVQRRFTRDTSEFSMVPGASISYWVPKDLRELYKAETVLDADNADLPTREGIGVVKQGLATGNDDRFFRYFWEVECCENNFAPISKGGEDAWLLPRISKAVHWEENGKEVRRYPGSYPRNTNLYFTEGVSFNSRKRSGRNFGYMHRQSVFSHVGTAIFPDKMDAWPLIAYLNSRLVTYLKFAQTFERKWEVSTVARLPVIDAVFDHEEELANAAKEQVANVVSKRSVEFTSPHFSGCLIAQMIGYELTRSSNHPHRTILDDVPWTSPPQVDSDTTFEEMSKLANQHLLEIDEDLERVAQETDNILFNYVGITDEQRENILREVGLRTIDDPLDNKKKDNLQTIPSEEQAIETEHLLKDFLLQLSMDLLSEDSDGIIPVSDITEKDNLLSRIEGEFERLFGEHADDRLAEVDQLLGTEPPAEEAYPNLRTWLEDDLFEYHISTFDRTPILWQLTTEQLVSDPEGEGFVCLVDYHQLDANVFDQLQNRYLEPRKAYLREQRSAANRRRSDDSLSTTEQAAAVTEYERCESGLEQISAFEDRMAELAQTTPRAWSEANQELAAATAKRVMEFRERTATRLETLEQLADLDDVDMGELFSPTFYETVQENREEWLDALNDLETAFEAYAKDGSEPVEAHLYDLFEYYHDLVGSSHYASNGILFMTYYFDKFDDAGQTQIGDGGVSERQRLLSELANDLGDYQALADEIAGACEEIAADISSDWSDRALSEITTAGYQPNQKHGVAINITPLAEKNIVPVIVEDKML
ncbi:BREX-5 system adenine-specific DNA-methyltransferase PglX [Halocatena salina]|uniref:site-specific DNA-methyltransferase (adenine-specific) n=1 Tax=Halocatena salina TaxID=2934340 RepID=A0A8U0A8P4_9EURY|nr:BREX-5 system adenine-specific DNA-methyltransferase PglX [Halocatena salina]UPM45334.1 BREX-5 system adenine-specific DNA-methyltransferase PglX [Halocatena salina]